MHNEPKNTSRREFFAATAGAAAVATIGFNRLAQAEDASELVTQIVRISMQEGKEAEAAELLTELTAAVEKNEPDVLAYAASRSQKDPSQIIFFEVYKNAEAAQAHSRAPHMMAMFPKFGAVFQPGMDIEKLDRIAGYTHNS